MMMETNLNNSSLSSAQFPITFFDGERELDYGTVQITPSLTFKNFQSILSQKLQISPHQITIYFERNYNNTLNHHNHHRRRHPVTSKFDFSSLLSDNNNISSSFFWVVLKRSRRTRRRKQQQQQQQQQQKGSFVLLKRDEYNYNNGIEYMEYMNRVRMQVERERDRYLMSMSLNHNVYNDLGCYYGGSQGYNGNFSDDGASSSGGCSSVGNGGGIGICDVCLSCAVRGEKTVPFHSCRNDVVTKVFKSPAGPIAPPSKNNNQSLG